MKKSLSLATLSFVLAAPASFSAVVFTENFAYPDGPLVGAAGSPWASHSGTAGQSNVASGAVVVTGSESEDVNANIAGGPGFFFDNGILTSTFNVSFSALPITTGSYFIHYRDVNNFRGRLFATTTGAAVGSFRLAIADTTTTVAPAATDLALNTTYVVVLSLNAATGRSSFSIDGGASVSATDATSAINTSTIALRQAANIGTLTVDNISVDVTVAAVPEPTVTLLSALGVIGVFRRRR